MLGFHEGRPSSIVCCLLWTGFPWAHLLQPWARLVEETHCWLAAATCACSIIILIILRRGRVVV